MNRQLVHSYDDIISLENLFSVWQEFASGKRAKAEVQAFALNLGDNIVQLHTDLANRSYKHGPYQGFRIADPKPRHIHKASVRDRVVHHALYRILYPFFDARFVSDSFSCRVGRGTHRALARFKVFASQVSRNNTRTCWVLKCDVRKFFASIDHAVLLGMLAGHILDADILRLIETVIGSFCTGPGRGLPLGNLTSQLFCNVYMNEFDQFVKHRLRARRYIRYCDDFVLLSDSKDELTDYVPDIAQFLGDRLKLSLHPNKVSVRTLASGIDFLGWVHFPRHRVLRTVTRRRMFGRVLENPTPETLQSYMGLLKHGNAFGIRKELLNWYGLCGGSWSR